MGRGKAWTQAEDLQLCRSYVYISENPAISTDQNSAALWKSVSKCFHDKMGDSTEPRTEDSLKNRWGSIQRSVNKFIGALCTVENEKPSGTTEDDRVRMAGDLYQRRHKSPFCHLSCWEILQRSPKFSGVSDNSHNTSFTSDNEDEEPTMGCEGHSCAGEEQRTRAGAGQENAPHNSTSAGPKTPKRSALHGPRPEGSKKAKRNITDDKYAFQQTRAYMSMADTAKGKLDEMRRYRELQEADFALKLLTKSDNDVPDDESREMLHLLKAQKLKQLRMEQELVRENASEDVVDE